MSESTLSRPNAYGILAAVALLASLGTTVLGGPSALGTGLFVFALGVVAVAMHRNGAASADEQPPDEDDENGESDAEKETRAQAGTMGMG